MIAQSVKADSQDTAEVVARFLFEQAGRLADIHGATPRELEATYTFAYNLYNQARWHEALRVFSFLVQEDHLDRRFHLGRGGCLKMLKRHEDALKAYGIAHLLDVDDPTVGLYVAECLMALGRRGDAKVALEAVIAIAEDQPRFADLVRRANAVIHLIEPTRESA